jgi:putative transposase
MPALQGKMNVERMCRLAEVSRAGLYRSLRAKQPEAEETAVRAAIQQVALEHHRHYGYRRITAELRHRGMLVNHKRVLRLMQDDNLLAIRTRKFIATTDSRHSFEVFLNLAKRMELTAPNQLWMADLTYIRLREEFVYMAVVLDAFSRRVVGWALSRSLRSPVAVEALEQAFAARNPSRGLVHHSDRGVQYASLSYVEVLRNHGVTCSMSRAGNPYDNARCESFIKTLKQEEIYCHEYRDLQDLRTHSARFIDEYYNRQRLHSALGYVSPDAFEQATTEHTVRAAKMSFSRHEEIYPNDLALESRDHAAPADHRSESRLSIP